MALLEYIPLLNFARTQKDSGSKLPVDKHVSLEDDSMDEGTPESLKIATPVPSKVSDENAPEEISSASEGITQVVPVVSQDLEPQTGKGLKNKKVPSKQLDNKNKEADVAIAELTPSEDDSLPRTQSSKTLPVVLDVKKAASIDDSNQPSSTKKDEKLTMEEKIENSKKAKKPIIEQEPPFAGMKLKKSKVVQREWKEPELETVQLKDHASEKLPQTEMVNSNYNNNFLQFLSIKKFFLRSNPICNGSICKHSRKS